MQKNNCKLKTIFKKGLSFSIALALGAAATSLNLAKTAEASATVTNLREVYLKGEKVSLMRNDFSGNVPDTEADKVTAVEETISKSGYKADNNGLDTVLDKAGEGKISYNDSSGSGVTKKEVTVYDWANIYKGTTVKVAHGTATNAMFTAENINFGGGVDGNSAAVREILNKGELHVDGIEGAVTKIDYTAHNGKKASVKVGNVDCPLGTLEVSRNVKAVSLAKEPTENCYIEGEKINLSGLALNVTYEDDGKATVEWTEETKDAFTFSSNDVGQDKEISQTINDITVTYEGVTATEKFTLYFCKTLSKEAGNIAKINGVFDKLDVVDAIALSENNDNYKKLKDDFSDENAQVIFAYDIIANYDASIGKMKVALNVGKNYAGQTVTVKHLSNDEIETFVDKVDSDGIVTVSVSSLSPFMVALGATEEDKSAAAETEQKNAEEKAEAAKKEAAAKSASKSVKTGDASIVAFSVFGFIAFVSAAILVFMKKNRKDFEK